MEYAQSALCIFDSNAAVAALTVLIGWGDTILEPTLFVHLTLLLCKINKNKNSLKWALVRLGPYFPGSLDTTLIFLPLLPPHKESFCKRRILEIRLDVERLMSKRTPSIQAKGMFLNSSVHLSSVTSPELLVRKRVPEQLHIFGHRSR